MQQAGKVCPLCKKGLLQYIRKIRGKDMIEVLICSNLACNGHMVVT